MWTSRINRTTSAVLVALAPLLPGTSFAAFQSATGLVTQPRVEGVVGMFTLAPFSGCGNRAWMDVSTPEGKAQYSTALLAFSMGRSVAVRVDDQQLRMFGECKLYDVVIL